MLVRLASRQRLEMLVRQLDLRSLLQAIDAIRSDFVLP